MDYTESYFARSSLVNEVQYVIAEWSRVGSSNEFITNLDVNVTFLNLNLYIDFFFALK